MTDTLPPLEQGPGDDPPPDYRLHTRESPVTAPWAPIYTRAVAGAPSLALRVRAAHANGRGLLHGGVLSTLADNAMGLAVAAAERGLTGLVTVSLSLDFIGAVRLGQWLEVVPVLVRATRGLAFTEARATADGEACARASAVFRVLREAGGTP
ncbi:PaaI family thioesterase [Zavarzinia compransoris]|uniref:Thioesterase domain-containing protein n=1 Tax=Zavarzinia compransoris TaxID=1264899 RepID=A0A317E7R3_9PROT|nr:PaaI family thioesterase [Zavarzinia compransoris]PWR22310.1 hypothetical protein DKG75_10160 [Zavarzinia compransoris]TDP46926.1 uncharacterized protein (TIGR00369 family) [Zavarzinia compransoris]